MCAITVHLAHSARANLGDRYHFIWITLETAVAGGQRLYLVNASNQHEEECRVIRAGKLGAANSKSEWNSFVPPPASGAIDFLSKGEWANAATKQLSELFRVPHPKVRLVL